MQSTTTPRFSDLELDAWRGFLRTHATLVRELDEELTERHGLPLSSYDVLIQLDETPEGRLRMSQLADAVLLSRSGLTRLVTRLEEARETHLTGVRERFLGAFSGEELEQMGANWRRLMELSATSE